LDFLDTIKLVNYVRSEVKAGNHTPDVSSKAKFEDDAYLKPVLEDDAVLYSLDDINEDQNDEPAPGTEAERKVLELQEQLERLQTQFSEYRLAVQKSLDDQLNKEDERLEPGENVKRPVKDRLEDADADYFTSYAYNSTFISVHAQFMNTPANIYLVKSHPRVNAERCYPYRCLP
jgi:protein arginine N-methyltransferase 3